MARVTVKLSRDHLQNLVRSPLTGLTELVWNALDAEASTVSIEVDDARFGGLKSLSVCDDGHGMSAAEVNRAFGALGESWKKMSRRSRTQNRALHGSGGKGRFSAFAIGTKVIWDSVYRSENGSLQRVVAEITSDSFDQFELYEQPVDREGPGTRVTMVHISEEATNQLGRASVIDHLAATFAMYLEAYSVEILWRGERVDPSSLQDHRETYKILVPGGAAPATVTVIEWKKNFKRVLYLCDESGMTLHEVPPNIQAPGFDFTAYLRWPTFRDVGSEILLAELGHERLAPVVEAARGELKSHFRRRVDARRAEMLQRWHEEHTYPYQGAPADQREKTERELFDIVAVTASKAIDGADKSARRLSLRLIREALQTNPTALRRVLTEVVELSAEQLEDLSGLLDRATLPSIISGTRVIADRLDFLNGLDALLFDRLSRRQTLERRQLHRILAQETWIFGEEYSLTGDDDRLLEVLRNHLGRLGLDTELAGNSPLLRYGGTEAIPDLVLSRTVQRRDNFVENLIVELKRPSVTIGRDELQQIDDYAYAVGRDERFNQPNVSWMFWIIGNDLDDYVRERAEAPDRAPGVVTKTKRYQVIAKTWAEVIADARHRLKFFDERLRLSSGRDAGLDHLRNTYARLLPAALQADVPVVSQAQSPDGSVLAPVS